MTAFIVSRIKVNDPAKMLEYAAATGPTIAAYGGSLVLRGGAVMTLIGEDAGQHVTSVVQFPDIDALTAWFNSPEYKQHAALRDEAGEMQFVAYQPISFEQFHAALVDLDGSLLTDVFTEVCRQIFDGRNAKLGDGVQKALGRAPRDFADFCERASADGVWSKAA